jgi:cholesterol transport system auxiliary component
MVYVQRAYELDYFADNRWADAPARMLGPLLTQALERSGGFRTVVQAPTAVTSDVRVNAELIRLQQNFTMRPSRAELALRVQLVDVRARRVLATKLFEEAGNAPSEDAYGGVAAANAALERILARVVEFCLAETADRPPPARSPP